MGNTPSEPCNLYFQGLDTPTYYNIFLAFFIIIAYHTLCPLGKVMAAFLRLTKWLISS